MPARRPPADARRPRRARLSRSGDFDRVYRQGRSRANRQLVVYRFPRPDSDTPRLGVSVSRKVGGAVERNRIKRLLREAFWAAEPAPRGEDFVIVARPPARELADGDGLEGLAAALGELLVEPGPEPAP